MAVKKPNSVRATLERIKAEAVSKARKGIAAQKAKSAIDPLAAALRKLKEGVNGPVPEAVSRRASGHVVNQFTEAFRCAIDDLSEAVQEQRRQQGIAHVGKEVLLYPDGCRFMYTTETNGVMVIEQAPQIRTILCGTHRLHLPMPYVVFIVFFAMSGQKKLKFDFQGIQVAFRSEPLTSFDDNLLTCHLPNCSGHTVCMGGYRSPTAASPSEVANHAIGAFWQSVFGSNFRHFTLGGKQVVKWPDWEAIGAGNPLDILKAEFVKGLNLSVLLKNSMTNRVEEQALHSIARKAWVKIADRLDTRSAQQLIANATKETLNQLLDDPTLQPQKS